MKLQDFLTKRPVFTYEEFAGFFKAKESRSVTTGDSLLAYTPSYWLARWPMIRSSPITLLLNFMARPTLPMKAFFIRIKIPNYMIRTSRKIEFFNLDQVVKYTLLLRNRTTAAIYQCYVGDVLAELYSSLTGTEKSKEELLVNGREGLECIEVC